MRQLPSNVDADAVIEVCRYLDDHARSTPVSISEALRVFRRHVDVSRLGDEGLEELIVESAAVRNLAVLLDSHE